MTSNELTMGWVRSLARRALALSLTLPALLPGLASADALIPPPIAPAAIWVPAENVPFLLGHATGTQNYACQPSAAGFDWTFVEPEAMLLEDNGNPPFNHFAGPTWQADDGSEVVAARVEGVTVSPTAIQWLLLRATSAKPGPDGGDRLATATYVQRVNATGGLAPDGGCDATSVGATANVPYTSDYYFYKPALAE
jgi:hypothetical protein